MYMFSKLISPLLLMRKTLLYLLSLWLYSWSRQWPFDNTNKFRRVTTLTSLSVWQIDCENSRLLTFPSSGCSWEAAEDEHLFDLMDVLVWIILLLLWLIPSITSISQSGLCFFIRSLPASSNSATRLCHVMF